MGNFDVRQYGAGGGKSRGMTRRGTFKENKILLKGRPPQRVRPVMWHSRGPPNCGDVGLAQAVLSQPAGGVPSGSLVLTLGADRLPIVSEHH